MTAFVNAYDRERQAFPMEERSHFEVALQEGGCTSCPAEWEVPLLRYGYHRLYYILEGDAWYAGEEGQSRLIPGHLYIFPSQARRYEIHHDPKHPLNVLWCHFELLPDFHNDLIDLDVAQDQDLQPLISLWQRFSRENQPGNEVYHVLMLILYTLDRRGELEHANTPFAGIERFVYDHLRENLTVEEVAKHFGYTRSYFSRLFKESVNLSPGEYLRVVRMSRAASLLRRGMSIGKVCEEIGYADRKVFSRAFSQYHGTTPSDYAKSTNCNPNDT